MFLDTTCQPLAIVLGDEDPAMNQENTTLALVGQMV